MALKISTQQKISEICTYIINARTSRENVSVHEHFYHKFPYIYTIYTTLIGWLDIAHSVVWHVSARVGIVCNESNAGDVDCWQQISDMYSMEFRSTEGDLWKASVWGEMRMKILHIQLCANNDTEYWMEENDVRTWMKGERGGGQPTIACENSGMTKTTEYFHHKRCRRIAARHLALFHHFNGIFVGAVVDSKNFIEIHRYFMQFINWTASTAVKSVDIAIITLVCMCAFACVCVCKKSNVSVYSQHSHHKNRCSCRMFACVTWVLGTTTTTKTIPGSNWKKSRTTCITRRKSEWE